MRYLIHRLIVGAALWLPFATSVAVPRYFQKTPWTRRDLPVGVVEEELAAIISPESLIFGPEDSRFVNATERHSTHAIPRVEVVVVPATEDDVPLVVSLFSLEQHFNGLPS